MFIHLQVGLLASEKLVNSAVPTAGLSQASGSAGGIIQAIGEAFDGLIGAAVERFERETFGRPARGLDFPRQGLATCTF
jgi:hypothetical protein